MYTLDELAEICGVQGPPIFGSTEHGRILNCPGCEPTLEASRAHFGVELLRDGEPHVVYVVHYDDVFPDMSEADAKVTAFRDLVLAHMATYAQPGERFTAVPVSHGMIAEIVASREVVPELASPPTA